MSKKDKNKAGQPQGRDIRQEIDKIAGDDRIGELTSDLQRLQAEFANFKRRSEEGRGEILGLAKQDVILQLLPLLDNIDRALSHRPVELADNAWAGGVEQVAKQGSEVLKNLGVTKIKSTGQPFDPHLHEAIVMEPGEGTEEYVTAELQPGYRLGDKVIRHAMVKVGHRRVQHPPNQTSTSDEVKKDKEDQL